MNKTIQIILGDGDMWRLFALTDNGEIWGFCIGSPGLATWVKLPRFSDNPPALTNERPS